MTLRERLDRFWYRPAPSERLSVVRIATGAFAVVYLLAQLPAFAAVRRFHASEFAPVGPVALLTEPLALSLVYAWLALTVGLGVAFVLGVRYRAVAPAFALAFLWVTSYRSSWGMKFHTENLVSLHLLLLAAAPAADTLSLDARQGRVAGRGLHGRYGWALQAMSVVTIVTYVLAGVAKLRLAGFEWLDGDVLRAQVAYDNLRKIELGSVYSPIGAFLVRFSWPFSALSVLTLALEFGAPAALFGRQLAKAWVLGVWSFHLGVLALMMIAFPYPLSFVAYLSFFEVERVRETRAYGWFIDRAQTLAATFHRRSVARD